MIAMAIVAGALYSACGIATRFATTIKIAIRTCRLDWPNATETCLLVCKSTWNEMALCPGLQKRVQPFPEDLERRLPPLPDTYRRVTLGVDILILDRRTQRIVDIIHDILRP